MKKIIIILMISILMSCSLVYVSDKFVQDGILNNVVVKDSTGNYYKIFWKIGDVYIIEDLTEKIDLAQETIEEF